MQEADALPAPREYHGFMGKTRHLCGDIDSKQVFETIISKYSPNIRPLSNTHDRIIATIMIVHVWWMAQCRGCEKWMYLHYAGAMQSGVVTAFEDPIAMFGKCPNCGKEDQFSGDALTQRPGPDPDANTQTR